MRKSLVTISLILVFLAPSSAQRMKYMDLLQFMETMSKEEYRNTLQEYLSFDLDHPHANLLLAMYYEKNYKAADPLARYEYALANANEAKIRYIKANIIVDEREVSRNNEYYAYTFKTKGPNAKLFVDYPVVSKKMNDAIDSVTLFLKKVPPIYQSFTRSVRNYDRAVKIFASLNNDFLSLDDLLLEFNQDTDTKLKTLKQASDSARFYFEAYLGLTKDYPLVFHKQKYHVKTINTYRLDGLITRMNFLTPDVEFWDYGKWADHVRTSLGADIAPMRTQLSQNEEKIDAGLVRINGSPTGEGVTAAKLDKQLIYNLNNFDKQSLALALLEYKNLKQDLLLKSKSFHVDTANIQHNAEGYSALIYLNKTADTLLNEVKARDITVKAHKHAAFIEKYYGGQEGVAKYIEEERKYIQTNFTMYSGELRSTVIEMATQEAVAEKDKMIRFGKWNISFLPHISSPEELVEKGEPVTLQRRRNPDGSHYLAGIYKPDKKLNNIVTFVARVNPDGKPGWFQSFNLKADSASALADAHNYLGPMELTQEGCAFIVKSVSKNGSNSRNTFIYLNEKGEDKFRVRLKEKDFPRRLNFIEKSNSFVILSKGQVDKENYAIPEPLILIGVNALGDTMWKTEVNLSGTVAALANLIDGFMVVGNYSLLKVSGKDYATTPGQSSPFLIRLNERGEIIHVNAIQTTRSVYVTNVIKVGDNSIHLVGLESTFEGAQGKSITGAADMTHIMTNRSCQVIFSNY